MSLQKIQYNGGVVQLDRITDFGSVGWGFESSLPHKLSLRIIIYFRDFFNKYNNQKIQTTKYGLAVFVYSIKWLISISYFKCYFTW